MAEESGKGAGGGGSKAVQSVVIMVAMEGVCVRLACVCAVTVGLGWTATCPLV